MNSDLMPSPEFSQTSVHHQPHTHPEADAHVHTLAPPPSQGENSSVNLGETSLNGNLGHRLQPIPPPSEPMQYRAIGLIRGRYLASSEQFTQGRLITPDGVELNAVLLGRIMSLVRNHLDLQKDHLWVVYPRTRQENDTLHLQIVGVWEPENLAKQTTDADEPENQPGSTSEPVDSSEFPDGSFSIRGEVVYQSFEANSLVVKIKQAPRKSSDKPKYFKLKMRGVLATKAVGKFWDFIAKRDADLLVVEKAEAIADLPKKRNPHLKGSPRRGGGKKPFLRQPNGEPPKPVKKTTSELSAVSKPIPKAPTPKPIKRPKPTED